MSSTDTNLDPFHYKSPYSKVLDEEETELTKDLAKHKRLQEMVVHGLEENLNRLKQAKKTGTFNGQEMDWRVASERYSQQFQMVVNKKKALKETSDDLEREKGRFGMVRKAAEKVHTDSSNVEIRSEKNKLYIGNRQHVSNHVKSNKSKATKRSARILDSGSWTWGLNLAWVMGGVEQKVIFKLKTDDDNRWAKMPGAIKGAIEENSYMSGDHWIELCRKNKADGNMFWIVKGEEDRPSWTTLEIATCLTNGYHFEIKERKNHDGTKIVLVKY